MYIIEKMAYGKKRFYSVIRQGVVSRETWTEVEQFAERFKSFNDAARIARDRSAYVAAAMEPVAK